MRSCFFLVLAAGLGMNAQTTAPVKAPVDAKIAAPEGKAPEAPKPRQETLHFNVNWPSGLSLGEGSLTSSQTASGWTFSMKVEAAIPAFTISEAARSKAGGDLCSLELRKQATRGSRIVDETTKFDASSLTATRQTGKGGGKSEIRISACAKDALTFLQFLRHELIAGRLPAAQHVYYGAGYQTRVQYVGTQRVVSNGEAIDADKLTVFIKGPSSEFSVDLLFARDAVRTPVEAVIPVAVGKFTVEFVR
jgi:hypothetical protein